MPHDKIKAATRRRMAQTGEPYAVARRAVLAEHQGEVQDGDQDPSPSPSPSPEPGYALLMSGEIRDWLAELRDGNPRAAAHVAQALAALMTEGAKLDGLTEGTELAVVMAEGTELDDPVSCTADSWPQALVEALELRYQERMERLTTVRERQAEAAALVADIQAHAMDLWQAKATLEGMSRVSVGTAEAQAVQGLQRLEQLATEVQRLLTRSIKARDVLSGILQRMQQHTDAFRARQTTLRAGYVVAQSGLDVQQIMAAPGLADGNDDQRRSDADAAIGTARAELANAVAAMERELGQGSWPTGLLDLRSGRLATLPMEPGERSSRMRRSVRILFAVEPPGSLLLIAVLDGYNAVDKRFPEALLAAADVLRQVRAGKAPEATEHRYDDAQSFLAEFQPPVRE
jgi:hypothetical protein